jgi:hypothetical protein
MGQQFLGLCVRLKSQVRAAPRDTEDYHAQASAGQPYYKEGVNFNNPDTTDSIDDAATDAVLDDVVVATARYEARLQAAIAAAREVLGWEAEESPSETPVTQGAGKVASEIGEVAVVTSVQKRQDKHARSSIQVEALSRRVVGLLEQHARGTGSAGIEGSPTPVPTPAWTIEFGAGKGTFLSQHHTASCSITRHPTASDQHRMV